jgi:hypothetical protein
MSDPSLIFDDLGGTVVSLDSGNDLVDISALAGPTTVFSSGLTGKDTIVGFGKNDLLVSDVKLFDSNDDGIIGFGRNKTLDLDGLAPGDVNADTLKFDGAITGLRYLGVSDDGFHAYGDASVRKKGWQEGTLGDDVIDASTKWNRTVLFDTALDAAWGSDTIINFGIGDRIATTSAIFDSDNDGTIDFWKNGLLDLNGDAGLGHDGAQNDMSPWGQVAVKDTSGNAITSLVLLGTETVSADLTYYYYGLAATA